MGVPAGSVIPGLQLLDLLLHLRVRLRLLRVDGPLLFGQLLRRGLVFRVLIGRLLSAFRRDVFLTLRFAGWRPGRGGRWFRSGSWRGRSRRSRDRRIRRGRICLGRWIFFRQLLLGLGELLFQSRDTFIRLRCLRRTPDRDYARCNENDGAREVQSHGFLRLPNSNPPRLLQSSILRTGFTAKN
jgi:hypothetical protein